MRKSFTLLEMLVVIGIIGVLVGFGALSYSTVQKKARDAKRQGDLKAAQQSLEQCYSSNSYQYPTGANLSISSGVITGICPATASLNFTLTDPLNSGTYRYTLSSTSSTYTITAPDLESSTTTFSVSNQQ